MMDARIKSGHDEERGLAALPERQHVQPEPLPYDPEQQDRLEHQRDRGCGRGAVTAELNFWKSRYAAGGRDEDVIAALLDTPDYFLQTHQFA